MRKKILIIMMTAVMAIAGIGGSVANMAGASEAKRANVSVPVKEMNIEAGIRKRRRLQQIRFYQRLRKA